MKDLDWRIRLLGGIGMVIGAGFSAFYAFKLKKQGLDFNQFVMLSLLAIWGGSDWILKGVSKKYTK